MCLRHGLEQIAQGGELLLLHRAVAVGQLQGDYRLLIKHIAPGLDVFPFHGANRQPRPAHRLAQRARVIEGFAENTGRRAIAAETDAVFDQRVVGRRGDGHRRTRRGRYRRGSDRHGRRRARGRCGGGRYLRHGRIDRQIRLVDRVELACTVNIEFGFLQRRLNPRVCLSRHCARLHQGVAQRCLKGGIGLLAKAAFLHPVEQQHPRHNGRTDQQQPDLQITHSFFPTERRGQMPPERTIRPAQSCPVHCARALRSRRVPA